MAYSLAQLEAFWEQAGGSIASAPQAAAIAYAESSGNATDVNPNDPNGGSFGLWQINGIHGASLAASGLTSWQTDPLQNAEAAVQVWKGAGQTFFSPTTNGGATGPWAAEGIAGSSGAANYQYALAQEAAGNLGAPATYPQNAVQQWITGALTGQTGPNAGTATAPVAGQAGGAAGTQVATTGVATPSDPLGIGTAISGLQTSWSTFWSNHPAWVILAGLVLLIVAWSLISGSNGTTVNLSTNAAGTAAEA
jgi:hypothetical protein